MEIQFTPLQPNKMEVKHQGSASPVTVKMLKTRRKRKSDEMDEVWPRPTNKMLCSFSMYYCDILLELYLILIEITEVYKYLNILGGGQWKKFKYTWVLDLWSVLNKATDFNLSRLWTHVPALRFLFAFYTALSMPVPFALSPALLCGIADQFYRIASFGLGNCWYQFSPNTQLQIKLNQCISEPQGHLLFFPSYEGLHRTAPAPELHCFL